MKVEVTGCDDCPFLDGEYETCMVPGMPADTMDWTPRDDGGPHYITPDWCPLREEPVTVEMKKP